MWPQAKESLAPPEAARGRKSPPLEPSERRWLSRHFYLGLAASRTVRIKFYCLNSSVCGTLLWQLWNENICCYINKQEMSQSSAIAGLQMWMRAPDTPIQWTLPSPTVIAKELGHYEKQGERGNRIGPRELRWKAWIQWTQRLASSHIVCSIPYLVSWSLMFRVPVPFIANLYVAWLPLLLPGAVQSYWDTFS